mmetsp:Transcript_87627/g.248444  ORF Transcript_87627/g.248444 Transcript_87627/m.248444 type:complete len:234 (-) Transcript_87627:716-1417(-)
MRCTSGPKVFERDMARWRPRTSSKLGRPVQTTMSARASMMVQTLRSERLGGCGAESAAIMVHSRMAANMGLVTGTCDSTAVEREKRQRKIRTQELVATSTTTPSSQLAMLHGRQTSPRTDSKSADQTCMRKSRGTATKRSRIQSSGARSMETMIQRGCTTVDHSSALPGTLELSDGPNALCTATVSAESTHVELATPISMALTEVRLLSSPAAASAPSASPPRESGPRLMAQR